VKIKTIDITNFKGLERFTLHTEGKNVLILGENGSGKTSLVRALEAILNSSRKAVTFERNAFYPDLDGAIEVTVQKPDSTEQVFTFRHNGTSTAYNVDLMSRAAKSKRFLEYKQLLRTYFLTGSRVNVFDLLLEDILADVENPLSQKSFSEDWAALQKLIPNYNTSKNVQQLTDARDKFVTGLDTVLGNLQTQALQMLGQFDTSLEFELSAPFVEYEKTSKSFPQPTVWLSVKFRGLYLEQHQQVLNEARLSAIAICLYFAAVLETPLSDLRVLVLDDVLIGLDLNNRLPLLNILSMDDVRNYQVFLLTYDPVWFDLVQAKVKKSDWKSVRIFTRSDMDVGVPIVDDDEMLTKAKKYAEAKDYKAAAVYARSAFERLLQEFCEQKKIKMRFVRQLKSMKSEDFFQAVCEFVDPTTKQKVISEDFKQEILGVRSVVLNPLSHAEVTALTEREVKDAVAIIRLLESKLEPFMKK
jgi:energy-coupling factor transporter ATP-binding protein EcfA2